MKPGVTIGQCCTQAKKFIQDRNSNLKLGNNFGFGIGFAFKEDALTINESNQTVLQSGMTFHVRVALSNVHKDAAKSIVAIGDTVLIESTGA